MRSNLFTSVVQPFYDEFSLMIFLMAKTDKLPQFTLVFKSIHQERIPAHFVNPGIEKLELKDAADPINNQTPFA